MVWMLQKTYANGDEQWVDTESNRRIDVWKSLSKWNIEGWYDEPNGESFIEREKFKEKAAAIVIFHDYITDNP